MIVWSLTTDTDTGLNTDLYLTEYQAYEALIRDWLPEESHLSYNGEATAALERGIPAVREWFTDYLESNNRDQYVVTQHDHPWTFGPEDVRFGKLRQFLAESPLAVVDAQAVSDIIDGPRETASDSEVCEDDELPETTFHNVTISIPAPTPKAAYERLCNGLAAIHHHCEWTTDTYQAGEHEGDTNELFPEATVLHLGGPEPDGGGNVERNP